MKTMLVGIAMCLVSACGKVDVEPMQGGTSDDTVVEVTAALTGPFQDMSSVPVVDSQEIVWGTGTYYAIIGDSRLDGGGNFWVYGIKAGDNARRHLYAMNFSTLPFYDANGALTPTTNLIFTVATPDDDGHSLSYCSSDTCSTTAPYSNQGTYRLYGDGNGGARHGVVMTDYYGQPWFLVVKTANSNSSNPPGCGSFPCGGPGSLNSLIWIQGSATTL